MTTVLCHDINAGFSPVRRHQAVNVFRTVQTLPVAQLVRKVQGTSLQPPC